MTTALPTETLSERLPSVNPTIRNYLRQSLGEDQQKESIPTQRAECGRLACSLGLSAAWGRRKKEHDYVDMDRHGDDFTGREQLKRLLNDATPGDIIIAWKQDRLGRDMIDSAATIRELVKHRRCVLYTVESGTTPITLDTAEQTAIVMLRGMIAQGELERIRSRTRDGLRQRARDGFASGTVPFGYRTVLVDPSVTDRKKSKKTIEIDNKLAPLVRRIFGMYADGWGYTRIAKALNSEGAASPRGKGWSPATLWDVLREPRYAGEWSHGERKVESRHGNRVVRIKASEDEVIKIVRPELAIIERSLWMRVQELIASRKRDMPAQRVASLNATVHMLSGTLACGGCGGRMRVKTYHGRRPGWNKRYYVCAGRASTGRCSNSHYLPADATEQKLIEYVRGPVLSEVEQRVLDAIRDEVRATVETANARSGEAQQITGEIQRLRQERQRLVKLAASTDAPEVEEALTTNQVKAKSLAEALAIATRPPIDATVAAALETAAIAQVKRMREQLTSGEAREALAVLFPAGLRFKVGSGYWRIEGAACVPTVRNPDGVRQPDSCRAQLRDLSSPTMGTRFALRPRMQNQLIANLLTDLHASLDRLAEDLASDRPDLAMALRKEAALIPRPEPLPHRAPPPPPAPSLSGAFQSLAPLLYRALDEGLLPHRRFDALMIRRARVATVQRGRK